MRTKPHFVVFLFRFLREDETGSAEMLSIAEEPDDEAADIAESRLGSSGHPSNRFHDISGMAPHGPLRY